MLVGPGAYAHNVQANYGPHSPVCASTTVTLACDGQRLRSHGRNVHFRGHFGPILDVADGDCC